MNDFIERARALDAAATAGPWEAYGTAIEAEAGPGGCGGCSGLLSPAHEPACYWSEVAGAGEADAEFIAAARSMLPAAVEALARVRGLHRKFGLYELEDSCTNTSEEHREERHHESSDDVGEFYCEDMPIGAVCDECRNEDGERLEWPCATYQATEVEA